MKKAWQIRFFGNIPIYPNSWKTSHNLYENIRRLGMRCSGKGAFIASNVPELITYVAQKRTRPLAFILHGDYSFYYKTADYFSGVIDKYFCVSTSIFEQLKEALPHRQKDIHLLFAPVIEKGGGDSEEKPRTRDCNILFVGRDTKEKGFNRLFEIDKSLQARNLEIKWEICCPTFSEESLNRLKRRINFSYHRGLYPNQIKKLQENCSLIILPSGYEGMPLSIVEGMGSGLVPILSDLPTLHELVSENEGFLCNTIEDYVNAIDKCFNNPSLYERLSKNARKKVEEKFSLEKNSEYFMETLSSIGVNIKKEYPSLKPYCSRLDKLWIPNWFVKTLRKQRQKK
jgi:glycosyltransferase involved in cell wall biosynthesis